ncbi:phosphonate C-P lyase system protein PhnH [Pseudanabaena sp. PCC 6802]|uniref:phosphonate C-P lyase system protein PhnH n=1 Tax=Pseudanabaena sp. PCC 6802 TaxID=118173 RepID=UPI000346B31A|nr:phosphonate C-P lyase system protein PhnH [Pseudanabaena sp. PCC 6802]
MTASFITPSLPGFANPVNDAQQTFRALLDACAHPGLPSAIASEIHPPVGLTPACASACLTLFDLDVAIWLQPSSEAAVKNWLQFHTGCQFATEPNRADFAVISQIDAMPELDRFNWGTHEQPEASTTLLIQIPSWGGGRSVTLTGYGILDRRAVRPQVNAAFWEQWEANHQAYPLGIDVFFFTGDAAIGLPRTTRAVRLEGTP